MSSVPAAAPGVNHAARTTSGCAEQSENMPTDSPARWRSPPVRAGLHRDPVAVATVVASSAPSTPASASDSNTAAASERLIPSSFNGPGILRDEQCDQRGHQQRPGGERATTMACRNGMHTPGATHRSRSATGSPRPGTGRPHPSSRASESPSLPTRREPHQAGQHHVKKMLSALMC